MIKHISLIFLFLLPFGKLEAVEQTHYKLPNTDVIPIKDTQSNRDYELYIKLPEKYSENSEDKYPVIYFTDAVWHIELLSAATAFLMEDAILVGISWQKDINQELKNERGDHVSRFRDYSINKSTNPEHQAKYQFGQAGEHLSFIRNDVFKYVESRYRADPDNRTYFGYSLGGLFGVYIFSAQPDTFRNYVLGSPSLQRDIPALAKHLDNTTLSRKGLHTNIFISHGTLEKELSQHIEEFIAVMKNKSDESVSLQHEVIEGTHQTAFPATGVRSVTWLSNLKTIEVNQ